MPPDHFFSHLRQDGQIDLTSSPDCTLMIQTLDRPNQKQSPAKQKRQERRKAARKEAATATETSDVGAEQAPNYNLNNESADINTTTEEVAFVEEAIVAEEVAAINKITELEVEFDERNKKLNDDIITRDDTIVELNEKVRAMAKENGELSDRIMVKTMIL